MVFSMLYKHRSDLPLNISISNVGQGTMMGTGEHTKHKPWTKLSIYNHCSEGPSGAEGIVPSHVINDGIDYKQ